MTAHTKAVAALRAIKAWLPQNEVLNAARRAVEPWAPQSNALDALMDVSKAAPPLVIQEEGGMWRFDFHDVADGDFPDWCTERGIDAKIHALKFFGFKPYTHYQGSCDQAKAVEMTLRWA